MLQITNLKVIAREDISKGALAKVEITFNHALQLRDLTLMENKEGGIWLAVPHREYELDGKKKYYKRIVFSRFLEDHLLKKIKEELENTANMSEKETQSISEEEDCPF